MTGVVLSPCVGRCWGALISSAMVLGACVPLVANVTEKAKLVRPDSSPTIVVLISALIVLCASVSLPTISFWEVLFLILSLITCHLSLILILSLITGHLSLINTH